MGLRDGPRSQWWLYTCRRYFSRYGHQEASNRRQMNIKTQAHEAAKFLEALQAELRADIISIGRRAGAQMFSIGCRSGMFVLTASALCLIYPIAQHLGFSDTVFSSLV